jgi:hypothetical protein
MHYHPEKLAKVTGPNQFSLTVGHRTTAKVDDCYIMIKKYISERESWDHINWFNPFVGIG